MATLLRSAPPVNSAISAVAWHALLKVADKESVRDDLAPGSLHSIDMAVSGSIDGEDFEQHIAATMTVGHDSTRATSATPALAEVVGAILAKLNTATREAILRDLPEQFAAAGCQLPEVPSDIAEKAAAMLVRLRAKKSVDVRGPVSCKYRLGEVESDSPVFAVVG